MSDLRGLLQKLEQVAGEITGAAKADKPEAQAANGQGQKPRQSQGGVLDMIGAPNPEPQKDEPKGILSSVRSGVNQGLGLLDHYTLNVPSVAGGIAGPIVNPIYKMLGLPEIGLHTAGPAREAALSELQQSSLGRDLLAMGEAFGPSMGSGIPHTGQTGRVLTEGTKQAGRMAEKAIDPIYNMLPDNSVGMFAGKLAKTADHAALAQAEQMAANGASREDIWNQTGWFRGVDGKWRFEIDDSGMTVKNPASLGWMNGKQTLPQFMQHADLYSAYPSMKNLQAADEWRGGLGSFDGKTMRIDPKSSPETARSTVSHEMQHATQDAEDFARGAHPMNFMPGDIAKRIIQEVPGARWDGKSKKLMIDGHAIDPVDISYDLYSRSAGEVEARAVQNRLNLSAEDRRSRPPWLDYDVPEQDQIVRFGGSGPQMSVPLRDVDKSGYYSQALEAAKGLKQAKGTPEQMLAQLKNAGVKQAEIDATGLPAFLDGKSSVTRDDLVRHLTENRVQLNEVISDQPKRADNRTMADLPPGQSFFNYRRPERQVRWNNYSLDPSNPTYRETVLHLPEPDRNRQMEQAAKALESGGPDAERAFWATQPDPNLQMQPFRSGHFPEPNIVGHMMTSMVKDAEGRPVYLIDQIQSDWGQKIRDKGFKDDAKIAALERQIAEAEKAHQAAMDATPSKELLQMVIDGTVGNMPTAQTKNRLEAELATIKASGPGHPLVNTTDQWVNTTLRKALMQAADAEAHAVAIPSGKTVLSYNPGDEHGMETFYNQIVPKNLGNLISKVDPNGAQRAYAETLMTPGNGEAGQGFSLFQLSPEARQRIKQGMPLFALPAAAAVGASNNEEPGPLRVPIGGDMPLKELEAFAAQHMQ